MSLVSRELLTLPEPIDALSLSNSSFGTYFYLIYSIDLEIKYPAGVSRSVLYIDIKLENFRRVRVIKAFTSHWSSGSQNTYLTWELG